MERQHLYERQNFGQGIGGGGVRGARVLDAPKYQNPLLDIFLQAVDTGKTAVQAGAKEYDRQMRGRMDDALLQTNAEFEKWKTDYMQTHQGVDALSAQQAFADKYQELSQAALGTFKDQYYSKQLEREFFKYGMYAVKQGGAYQMQQDEAWQKSQWNAQLSNFEKIVQNNPNDPDMIAMEQQALLQSWMAKNPGLDPGAMRDKIQSMASEGRMNALLASGMNGNPAALDEAEKLLGKNPGASAGPVSDKIGDGVARWESGKDGIQAIGYDPNGGTSYGKWQLSSKQGSYKEWIDHLEKTGEKGAAIAKELRAAGASNTGSRKGHAVDVYKRLAAENPELFEQSQREYLTKSHYGRAMSSIPANARSLIEGNKALQEMVFSTSVQHGGGGAARIIKRAWKEGMSEDELVRAVYAGRANPGNFASTPSGMAQNITGGRFPEERDYILSQLAGGKAATQPAMQPGASPALAGLSPEQQITYRNKIDAVRRHTLEQEKAAQQAALAQNVQTWVSSMSDLSQEQREAAVYTQINQIKDPEQRKSALSLAKHELDFQNKKQQAQRAFAVSSLVQQSRAEGDDPAQAEIRVLQSGLNEEDQKEALKRIRGEVKENELNMRATAVIRRQIDEAQRDGKPMDDDTIFRLYQKHALTQAQLNDLLKYRDEGGKIGHVTQSEVHNIWKDLQGIKGEKKKADEAPPELYAAVLKLLPDGRKPTYDDIKNAISKALVEGKVSGFFWDSSYTRAEAMAKGKIKEWRQNEEGKTVAEKLQELSENEISKNEHDY